MPRAGPKKVHRYSLEFKLKAVQLSQLKGVEVQAVADALEIHPFMLSRWRKEAPRWRAARSGLSAKAGEGAAGARDEAVSIAAACPCAAPRGACAAKKTHPVHLRTKADVFAFIEEERKRFGVTRLCRLFGVTRAGFYAWRRRPVSARRRQDRDLLEAMRAIFEGSGGTYGSPRIQQGLAGRGHQVSRRRVERLMRADGMRGRVARVYRPKAGTHRWFRRQPNHVRRTRATRPNQIWVGDVTYLGVGGRWWYLIVVLDQCSRRVLACRLAATRDSRVTRAVLDAALRRRRPDAGLIFHSDRGSEFQGTPVRTRLAASGVRQSMTRGGAPGENAHMESFFIHSRPMLIHGRSFLIVDELRQQLRRYVRYDNYQRLHSSLGYQSPVDYERRAA